MATEAAMGRRRADAAARIEAACARLGGSQSLVLPTFSRYGQDMLLILQLEAIAAYLEAVEPPPVSPYMGLTVRQLTDLLTERGLDKGTARTRSELTALLEAADDAAKEGERAPAL